MLRLGAEYADLFSNSRRRMMVEKTADGHRLNWRLPLYAVVGTFIVFIAVAISDPPDMWLILYTLLVAPIITLSLLRTTILKGKASFDTVHVRRVFGYFSAVSRKSFRSSRLRQMAAMVA